VKLPHPSNCCRCGASFAATASTMSRFNTDIICLGCIEREQAHPKYREAADAELQAVRRGDYNFPGIGCPPDLYRRQS
jgi:hypothetical protein